MNKEYRPLKRALEEARIGYDAELRELEVFLAALKIGKLKYAEMRIKANTEEIEILKIKKDQFFEKGMALRTANLRGNQRAHKLLTEGDDAARKKAMTTTTEEIKGLSATRIPRTKPHFDKLRAFSAKHLKKGKALGEAAAVLVATKPLPGGQRYKVVNARGNYPLSFAELTLQGEKQQFKVSLRFAWDPAPDKVDGLVAGKYPIEILGDGLIFFAVNGIRVSITGDRNLTQAQLKNLAPQLLDLDAIAKLRPPKIKEAR